MAKGSFNVIFILISFFMLRIEKIKFVKLYRALPQELKNGFTKWIKINHEDMEGGISKILSRFFIF